MELTNPKRKFKEREGTHRLKKFIKMEKKEIEQTYKAFKWWEDEAAIHGLL